MASPNKEIQKSMEGKQYPWSHLFTDLRDFADEDDDEEEIIDILHVKAELQQKETEVQAALKMSNEMKDISQKTFDDMSSKIECLEKENRITKEALKVSEEALKVAEETGFSVVDEIMPVVLTQSVLAHSRRLTRKETQKKILAGVHKWLKQRQKVVKYLQDNDIFSKESQVLQKVLFELHKSELVSLVDKLTVSDEIPSENI